MEITKEESDRLKEIVVEIQKRVNEFKAFCLQRMSRAQYEQFKYCTLGHLEPGLFEDSDWVTSYSSIYSLEKVANDLADEVEEKPEENESELDKE